MPYAEFFITQHADAHAYNGGSGQGASKTGTVWAYLSSGETVVLTLGGGGTWAGYGVVAGDWGLWDCDNATATSRQSFVVVSVDSDTEITVKFGASSPTAGPKNLRIGGAWALPSSATAALSQWGSARWAAQSIADPPRINIKYEGGTAYDSLLQFTSVSWSHTLPMVVAGYETAPGDLDWWTTDKRAVISNSSNTIIANTSLQNFHYYNLKAVTSSASSPHQAVYANSSAVSAYYNVEAVCTVNANGSAFNCTGKNAFYRCSAYGGADGFYGSGLFDGCSAKTCSRGYRLIGNPLLLHCLAAECSASGFQFANAYASEARLVNCTSVGNLIGVDHGGSVVTCKMLLLNCVIASNTGGVVGTGGGNQGVLTYGFCNFHGNTVDFSSMDSRFDIGGNIAVDPGFVNASSDYRITSTSGCKAAGLPKMVDVFSDSTPVPKAVAVDIGALQRVEPTLPSTSDVRNSTQFGDGGTEKTGVLTLPAVGDVENGVPFDGGTQTGTLVIPSTSDVKNNTKYGAGGIEHTGILELPAEENVKDGVLFGAMEEYRGEYPTTEASKAEQLAVDEAVVAGHAGDIRDGVEILGTEGTLVVVAGLTAQDLRDAMNLESTAPIDPGATIETQQQARNAMNLELSE